MKTDNENRGRHNRWWHNAGYIVLGKFLSLLSLLPLRVLYIVSDILYLLAFHLIRYRRKVAKKNISESFPSMSEEQVDKTVREFYRNPTDIFVETVKLLHISDQEMMSRMEFRNAELIDRYIEEGRSVCIYFSHCGNWEWAPSVTLWSSYLPKRCPQPVDKEGLPLSRIVGGQIYRPLRNKWFDEWYLKLRSRFGTVSYPKRTSFRDLLRYRRDGIVTVTGFMSDQKPSHGDPTYVTTFLNHPTAMITGTETLARKLDMGVVYWDMEKLARGRYRITVRPVADRPAELKPMELTDRYTRMLQTTIERNPSIWLWTHKRWKNPVTLPPSNTETKQ